MKSAFQSKPESGNPILTVLDKGEGLGSWVWGWGMARGEVIAHSKRGCAHSDFQQEFSYKVSTFCCLPWTTKDM